MRARAIRIPRLPGAPPKKPKIDREGMEQAAYFSWLETFLPNVYEHAYAIPNGGMRFRKTAGKLKAQGAKAGVLDINIDIPRGCYHGLRIEMKATPPYDASISAEQREWLRKENEQGYFAVVCKGLDAAYKTTLDYMALGPFKHLG